MTRQGPISVAPLISAVALLGAIAATAGAQTLAELAEKEEARREAIKTPGKVLTVDTIRAGSAPATPPAPRATESTTSKTGSEPSDKKAEPEGDRKAQEASWRARMQGARDALQRSQMFAEALQSRINGLTADFTSRDDPAQRAVVANDRQKALAELDRVKDDIERQTKAIADIQDEARKANVPPGWLR